MVLQAVREYIGESIDRIRQRGSFAQNLMIALSGTAISTAIGFLLTPIITRIYSPEAYGLFSVYYSIINNATLVSLLAYGNAYILPKEKNKFIHLVQLTGVLTLVSVCCITICLYLGGQNIVQILNIEKLGNWIYLIPLGVLLICLNNILNGWNLRDVLIKRRSISFILLSICSRLFAIGYGVITDGGLLGLIVGELFGLFISVVSLFNYTIYKSVSHLITSFSFSNIKRIALEYKNYPLYILPSSYFTLFSLQMPIFILTSHFGASVVGLFAFASGMLEIPGRLIGDAVAPVFFQKATETQQAEPEKLKQLTLNVYNKLLYIGIAPFAVLTIFGDIIFKYFFGEAWIEAGKFAGYLGFFYIFRLIFYPIESVYRVLGRERFIFIYNTVLLILRVLALVIGIFYDDIKLAIILFSIVSLIFYISVNSYLFHLLKINVVNNLLKTIIVITFVYFLMGILRYFIDVAGIF